jgi:AcrR family transcriptional regulator/predicted RNA-binding Zn ribbon-like protein
VSPARRSTRARILDAADRMFTEHGIRAVGVDAIVAAADTAKTTLYAHFGSKDALVVAYLQRRATQRQERLEQALTTHRGSPVEQILRLYDLLAAEIAEPGYRGSPFANSCVELGGEHPAAAVAREHRQWLLDTFTELATETAAADPDSLAAQLLLLHEAAATQVGDAARTARTAAEALMAAAHIRTSARGITEHQTGPDVDSAVVRRDLRTGGSPEAHRLVAFLNSAHLPDGDDQLADDRAGPWLAQWLTDAGQPAPAGPDAPTDLLALREGLRQLAGINCGTPADPAVVGAAQAVLDRSPLLVKLAAGGEPHVTSVDRDNAALLATAVAADAFLAVQARGEWLRLKVCASPDCRWAFWDGTRNRSRRWCDMAGCGNRAKNRAWRSRQSSVTTKIS